jgi:hypothetical protein
MLKPFQILNRIALILGVLVALTPCGICHGAMDKSSKTCSMTSMPKGMDCCHKGKQANPLCKIMDQSSTAAAPQILVSAPVLVVSFVSPLPTSMERVSFPHLFQLDTSPFQAPLSLRI